MGDKRVAVAGVGVGAGDDLGEGMQCSDHPYRSNPGGICAFCLQEKLGKLVSSSKSSPFFAPPHSTSSSSSPTSFRSDGLGFGFGAGVGGLAGSASSGLARTGAGGGSRTRIPFLAAAHKKKKSGSYVSSGSSRKVMASSTTIISSSSSSSAVNNLLTLKRSKSVAPRPVGGLSTEGGSGIVDAVDSPRKKSFWSFLYLSSSSSTSTSSSSANNNGSSSSSNSNRRRSTSSSSGGGRRDRGDGKHQQQRSISDKALVKEEAKTPKREHGGGGGEEVESPSGSQASSSFGRKVARSRSVGCGSRSFSGDFFERISTGFGDCTLRRVESHREAKSRMSLHVDVDDVGGEVDEQQRFKERVKCGGFFGGFGMISSSYWLPADDFDGSRRISSAAAHGTAARGGGGGMPHSRSWAWAWAFASPMRALRPAPSSSKPSFAMNGAATATNVIMAVNAGNNIINGAALPAAAETSEAPIR
ncbi:hypothetical protein COCNU_06G014560 [Cocos nucifera]|uniref:Uncharacterized protein n=1 Tax=Cocos nucifera TaxID=13894 RepID=A0A8K0ID39_COCNU|nr:hypothetical protein COCNU_06G014560 [Cocos nucifera]